MIGADTPALDPLWDAEYARGDAPRRVWDDYTPILNPRWDGVIRTRNPSLAAGGGISLLRVQLPLKRSGLTVARRISSGTISSPSFQQRNERTRTSVCRVPRTCAGIWSKYYARYSANCRSSRPRTVGASGRCDRRRRQDTCRTRSPRTDARHGSHPFQRAWMAPVGEGSGSMDSRAHNIIPGLCRRALELPARTPSDRLLLPRTLRRCPTPDLDFSGNLITNYGFGGRFLSRPPLLPL